MADWGLLAGLGNAATILGGAWSDQKKDELALKLEQEREARAEQHQIAREERQRMRDKDTASEYKVERDAEGVTWRQGYNKFGERTGAKELASAEDIKQYNFSDQKNKLSLDKVIADTAKAKAEADNLPVKYARDAEKFEADMDYLDARTERARRPSTGRGGSSLEDSIAPVNDTDVAAALIKEYPALVKESGLTASEAFDLALATIREARSTGKDPADTFRIGLPMMAQRRKARKGTGKEKKTSGLNLGD